MAGGGISPTAIARQLNDEGIPSPSQYFVLKGFLRGEKYSLTPWRMTNVKGILTNRMYLGCIVYGKTTSSIVKGTHKLSIPKEDWQVVENTHEPLITPELFRRNLMPPHRSTIRMTAMQPVRLRICSEARSDAVFAVVP